MKNYDNENNKLEILASWMKESKFTVVFTGAGMSTESGIPDFRSKDGWWKKIDPRSVATTEALNNNYTLFHQFYSMRIKDLKKCTPHKGHYILADWERKNIIHSIATQNVDGFHRAAGSKNVYELHGSIYTVRCNSCEMLADMEDFLLGKKCKGCRGRLRPNVVLFGEMLPQNAWNKALKDIEMADLVLIIGTSLEVYPVNQLPFMTDGKVVLINNEIIEGNYNFDLVIKGKAKEVLQELNRIYDSKKKEG